MPPDQKRAHWQHHIARWQQSSLSQKAYCAEHGLSLASFGYWRKQIKKHAGRVEKKLIPVTVARTTDTAAISLPTGIRIELPVQALAEVLPLIYPVKPEHS